MVQKQFIRYRGVFLGFFVCMCTFFLIRNYRENEPGVFIDDVAGQTIIVESHRSPVIQLFDQGGFSFKRGQCPVHCDFKGGKVLLEEADAVVFPSPDYKKITTLKKTRRERQIWVFTFQESPHIPRFAAFPNPEVWNWTITYRLDSDVRDHFYGRFRLKEGVSISPEMIQGLSNHSIPVPPEKMDYYKKKFLEGKTKLMAWTSSHRNCDSSGGREGMVKILDDILGVDKFGACGTFKCKKGRFAGDYKSCYKEQGAEYKFYLAFENSVCTDYVSEKFYAPLQNGMIPIGYGGANYSLFGPPGSFIDSLAFPTVHEFLEHLIWLDENPEEYLKYFLWTEYYEVLFPSKIGQWCALCQKLWDISVFDDKGHRFIDPNYKKIHKNISNWWGWRIGDDDEEESNPSSKWLPTCLPKPKLVF